MLYLENDCQGISRSGEFDDNRIFIFGMRRKSLSLLGKKLFVPRNVYCYFLPKAIGSNRETYRQLKSISSVTYLKLNWTLAFLSFSRSSGEPWKQNCADQVPTTGVKFCGQAQFRQLPNPEVGVASPGEPVFKATVYSQFVYSQFVYSQLVYIQFVF